MASSRRKQVTRTATEPAPRRPSRPGHSMRHFLELGRVPRSRRKWIAMAVLVLLAGAVIGVLFLRDVDFDWQRLNQTIDRLPPLAVLPLMAILPVFGFPVVLV